MYYQKLKKIFLGKPIQITKEIQFTNNKTKKITTNIFLYDKNMIKKLLFVLIINI